MSEDNAQNHANFADAFIMTARAIKIDKRLPCFFGGRAGNINQTGCERPACQRDVATLLFSQCATQAAQDLSFKVCSPST